MRIQNGKAVEFTPILTTAPINGMGTIDDDHILTTSTWSSSKISNEIDTQLASPKTIEPGSNVVEITDAADLVPAKHLALAMAPKQDLNGYSKPWAGGAGKNLLPPFGSQWVCGSTGSYNCRTVTGTALVYPFVYDTSGSTAYANVPVYVMKCAPSTEYTLTPPDGLRAVASEYAQLEDVSNTSKIIANWATGSTGTGAITRATSATANYLVIAFSNWNGSEQITVDASTEIQLELGSTATSYEPYSNICPITGWDTVDVERTGKNLLDATNVLNAFINTSTRFIVSNANARCVYAPCKPNTTYTISKTAGSRFIVAETSDVPANGVAIINNITNNTAGSISITTSASAKYLVAFVWLSTADTGITADEMLSSVQLELGSTATDYEPYQGQTIIHNVSAAAGGTVYGGTLTVNRDWTGTLEVNKTIVDIGTLAWSAASSISGLDGHYRYNASVSGMTTVADKAIKCSALPIITYQEAQNGATGIINEYFADNAIRVETTMQSTAADFKTAMSGVMLSYPLATPQTYTLTTEQITTLLGYNRITSDAEITSLTYYMNKQSTLEYVQQVKAELQDELATKADKNNTVLTGTISHNRLADSTAGQYSVATGLNSEASGAASMALGNRCQATDQCAVAIGQHCVASSHNAFAAGLYSEATGPISFAMGNRCTASGENANASGHRSVASGANSNATGQYTTASGDNASAAGRYTTASGANAHAEGDYTIANHRSQHVFGEYNVEDDATTGSALRGNYVEIVGNGTETNARSNARTLDWSGNEVISGTFKCNNSITIGNTTITEAQLIAVLNLIANGAIEVVPDSAS